MECRTTRDRFSAYLDGELPAAEARVVAAHLEGCPTCAAAWRQFSWTVAALRALPRARISDLGAARLQRALALEAERRRVGRRPWPAVAAAVVVLALVGGVGWFVGFEAGDEAEVGRVEYARSSPRPLRLLRDARTGGWIRAEQLARQVRRAQRRIVLEPRVRVAELPRWRERLQLEREQLKAQLVAAGLDPRQVHFREPVTVGGSLLDGPAIEWWVRPLERGLEPRVAAGAGVRFQRVAAGR